MACDGLNLYLSDGDIGKLKNGGKIIFDNFELGQLSSVMSIVVIGDDEFPVSNSYAMCPEPLVKPETKIEIDEALIHGIIDKAMEKRDRSVSIYFGEQGVSLNVYPYSEEEDEE